MLKPSGLLIPDKPTTELVELDSQICAEIQAINTIDGALLGMSLVQILVAIRRQLKIRAANQ